MHLETPVHLSLNKPSSIRCIAHQSRPPVRILIAINGELVIDEFKYSTEIYEIPFLHASRHQSFVGVLNNQTHPLLKSGLKTYSLVPGGSELNIQAESLRTSYYDTYTNVTIEDINMRMQGQTVECFAYSFLNYSSNHKTINELSKSFRIDKFQNEVMSTKSTIQIDCECLV